MSKLAECSAADANVLSTFLDCLNALPTCSSTEMASFVNAADACSAAAGAQLSPACLAATQIE